MDIPEGRSAEADQFVQSVADHLDFEVSEAQFPAEKGPPNHVWEIYGRGVSMFLDTAIKGGDPDRYGNEEVTFNPNRLGFNVAKTGWWQRVDLEDVVTAARDSANQLGWRLSKAEAGESCAT